MKKYINYYDKPCSSGKVLTQLNFLIIKNTTLYAYMLTHSALNSFVL